MYGFFDLLRNSPALPINNFLLIPAKVVICFPTVFCNFIPITIAIPDRSFVFIRTRFYRSFRFTKVDCFAGAAVNLTQAILFLFSVAARSLL